MKAINRRAKDTLSGYLFSAPAILLFLSIGIFSVFFSVYLSFVSWEGNFAASRFVGFQYFKGFILGHSPVVAGLFRQSLIHNFVIAFVSIAFIIPLAFILAYLVNRVKGGMVGFFRTIYFLPLVCSGVAIYSMWRAIFVYDGLFNAVLTKIGLTALVQSDGWLASMDTALGTVIVTVIWQSIPGVLILYYAALKTVDAELYESAEIDGAKMHHKLMFITWPLVKPITAIAVIQLLNGTFQMFENIWVLTQGGPANATQVTGTVIYKIAFESSVGDLYGYSPACAVGWTVFLITLGLSFICVRTLNSER